nr:hypothetical protein CFP56_02600 [Quercus suber]
MCRPCSCASCVARARATAGLSSNDLVRLIMADGHHKWVQPLEKVILLDSGLHLGFATKYVYPDKGKCSAATLRRTTSA